MVKGAGSSSTLVVALALFGLAGSVVAAMVPRFFAGSERPGFAVFLAAGVLVIALTAGLFAYLGRLGIGFGGTALVLAAGYNALIAAVKVGLAPAALYEANRERPFDTSAGDPNSPLFYAGVGAAVLVLYLGVFRVMYRVFKRRLRLRTEGQAPGPPARRWGGWSAGLRVSAVLTVVAVLVAGLSLWWVPALFIALPALSYLGYIFATFGLAVAAALGLAGVIAYTAFDRVERRAARLGDATLLAGFFWLGLALILLYHVMWAVFLLSLVSI